MEEFLDVAMPGSVYYECFDPGCTEFPREHPEIGAPAFFKRGRGVTVTYRVTRDVAVLMLSQAHSFGEAQSYGVDDPSAGRRVLQWVEREAERLGVTEAELRS